MSNLKKTIEGIEAKIKAYRNESSLERNKRFAKIAKQLYDVGDRVCDSQKELQAEVDKLINK